MTCNCPLYGQHLNGTDSYRPFYCDVWTWRRLGNSISSLFFFFLCFFFLLLFYSFVLVLLFTFSKINWIRWRWFFFFQSVCACSRLYVDAQIQFMVRSLAGYFMKLSIVRRRCTHQNPFNAHVWKFDFSFVFQFKMSVRSTSFNWILMCRAVFCCCCCCLWWWWRW